LSAPAIVAEIIRPFLPPAVPDCEDHAAWDLYIRQCETAAATWQHSAQSLYAVFEQTPSLALLQNTAHTIGHVGTNIFVGHHVTQLVQSLAAQCALQIGSQCVNTIASVRMGRQFINNLQKTIQFTRQKIRMITNKCAVWGKRILDPFEETVVKEHVHSLVTTEGLIIVSENAEIINPHTLQNFSSEIPISSGKTAKAVAAFASTTENKIIQASTPEIVPAAPHIIILSATNRIVTVDPSAIAKDTTNYMLISDEALVADLVSAGKRFGFSEEQSLQAIAQLNNQKYNMCAKTFNQAIKEFEGRPGVDGVIKNVYQHCLLEQDALRATGFCYELAANLKFEYTEGHAIREFSKRMIDLKSDATRLESRVASLLLHNSMQYV